MFLENESNRMRGRELVERMAVIKIRIEKICERNAGTEPTSREIRKSKGMRKEL